MSEHDGSALIPSWENVPVDDDAEPADADHNADEPADVEHT